MSHIIRIILGAVVLVGTFTTKGKMSLAFEGEGGSGVASLFGREVTPSSLNMILAVFAILGIVLIVLGVMGLVKSKQ